MATPPKVDFVKFVTDRRTGKRYGYFNTGRKVNGKPVRVRLPDMADPSFWPTYGTLRANRDKVAHQEYTVASLAADYEQSGKFAQKAENTRILYAKMLDKITATWGKFPANKLEPVHVRKALERERWGSGNHNMVLAVLGAMYTWGRRNEKTKAEPTKDIERLTSDKHDAWPEDIVEAALRSDDATVRLAVHLMYFTGLRIGDAINLRWGDVRGDEIHITPQKTRRFRKTLQIPMAGELRDELARTPRVGITILHGLTDRQLRRKLQAFTLALGVRTVPHGLRTNAVEALLLAGCTVGQVAAITGQTFKIVEHYAAKVNNRLMGKAAIVKLDAMRRTNA